MAVHLSLIRKARISYSRLFLRTPERSEDPGQKAPADALHPNIRQQTLLEHPAKSEGPGSDFGLRGQLPFLAVSLSILLGVNLIRRHASVSVTAAVKDHQPRNKLHVSCLHLEGKRSAGSRKLPFDS